MQHLEGQIGETQSENKAHLKAIQDQVRQAQQHNAQQLDAMQKSIAKTQGAVHVAEQKVRALGDKLDTKVTQILSLLQTMSKAPKV
eukprot:COSAG01_NODE_2594_length_7402_cov_7.251951_3_plen_86_part_00